MTDDPFSPSKLLELLPKLLPLSLEQLSTPIVTLAALVHAIHVNLGFRLDPPHSQAEGVDDVQERNRLPDEWGQAGRDLSFHYKHEQSAMTFEVSITKLGSRAIVNAIAVEVCILCTATRNSIPIKG
jgi:proteasome inhibitor subunit 1 (PI31)